MKIFALDKIDPDQTHQTMVFFKRWDSLSPKIIIKQIDSFTSEDLNSSDLLIIHHRPFLGLGDPEKKALIFGRLEDLKPFVMWVSGGTFQTVTLNKIQQLGPRHHASSRLFLSHSDLGFLSEDFETLLSQLGKVQSSDPNSRELEIQNAWMNWDASKPNNMLIKQLIVISISSTISLVKKIENLEFGLFKEAINSVDHKDADCKTLLLRSICSLEAVYAGDLIDSHRVLQWVQNNEEALEFLARRYL